MPDNEEINDPAVKDPANEITPLGQVIAAVLLIFFTLLPGFFIIAYWPDKLPSAKEPIKPLYINEMFHVRLAGIPDSTSFTDSAAVAGPVRDSAIAGSGKDSVVAGTPPPRHHRRYALKNLIHINTLLLLLVAAAGFLGNMIYITSSFTTFVGAVKFKRSWLLWYFVKPFTAAGLALGVYFVFRGGFLNMSDDSTNINIYGLITISILTGLYTDRATLKLGEVVNTIFGFKPNENDHRPDKLHQVLKIIDFSPAALVAGKSNTFLIHGENLDTQKLLISINDAPITDTVVSPTAISFQYTPPVADPPLTDVKLVIKGEDGKEYLSTSIRIK